MPTMSEPVNEACRSDRPSCSKTSNMQLRNSCTFSATFNRRSTLFNVASQYFSLFFTSRFSFSQPLNRLFFHTFFLSLFRQCLSLSLSFSLLAYLLKRNPLVPYKFQFSPINSQICHTCMKKIDTNNAILSANMPRTRYSYLIGNIIWRLFDCANKKKKRLKSYI